MADIRAGLKDVRKANKEYEQDLLARKRITMIREKEEQLVALRAEIETMKSREMLSKEEGGMGIGKEIGKPKEMTDTREEPEDLQKKGYMKNIQEFSDGRDTSTAMELDMELAALRAEVETMKSINRRNLLENEVVVKEVKNVSEDETKGSRKMAVETDIEKGKEAQDQSNLE